MAGQQFDYDDDDIGNRAVARAGEDDTGMDLREWLYSPNLLNQYDDRTVPAKLDIIGVAERTQRSR